MNKPEISRRDVLNQLREGLHELYSDEIGTRRGRVDQTFHIDGRRVIGRGSVSSEPVNEATLVAIHRDVYLLDRMRDKIKIHVSYGGYTDGARSFAGRHGISLFTFDQTGLLSQMSDPVAAARRSAGLAIIIGLFLLLGLAVGGIGFVVYSQFWLIGKWVLTGLAVLATLALLGAVGWVLDFVRGAR